jgi:hypothetical protein
MRLKLSIEKHELKIIRFDKRIRIYCLDCHSETVHLTVSQLAELLSVSEIGIFRLCESKQLHSTAIANGRLMVCVDSATKDLLINDIGVTKQ